MHVLKRRDPTQRRLSAALGRMAELEGELARRGRRDPISGLWSLGEFGERLDAEVDRARRHGRQLSVAMLDVDRFRALNASHGRAVGDVILATVGHVLARYTRSSDVACRASADEFAVMFPEAHGGEAMRCLERILLELEATQLETVDCISVSAGVAIYRRHQSSDQLLARAGQAMDRARAAGGGRAVLLAAADEQGNDGDDTHEGVIRGLSVALLERDRYTGEHSESVVEMAARLARSLGLDEAEVERVRTAALLHDIGKVAIPDEVLRKPGRLGEAQWGLMREHPVIGERILRAIPGLGGVARLVRHEHERWDGCGYPDGLRRDEIPIGSRIILACDAYHAMTSDRPYREAMSHAEALRELASCAGTQFDPRVTEVLIGHLYGRRQASLAAAVTASERPPRAEGPVETADPAPAARAAAS